MLKYVEYVVVECQVFGSSFLFIGPLASQSLPVVGD